MKKAYSKPFAYLEEFTPNTTIAACGNNTELTFSCMDGGSVDTGHILAEGCSLTPAISYGIKTINNTTANVKNGKYRYYNASGDDLLWSGSGDILTAKTNDDSIKGIMYICSKHMENNTSDDYFDDHWSYSGSVLTHTESGDKSCTHVMIAPLYSDEGLSSVATS